MRTTRLRIVAYFLLSTLSAGANAETWTRYANPRFGTVAEYPSDLFRAQRAPDNGDGQSFVARDGAKLVVFGGYNIDNARSADYETFLRKADGDAYATVTYRASGADWLVLSGRRGSSVFYERYLFRDDVIHGLVATYPVSSKSTYDPIVARMARSLTSGEPALR